MKKAKLLLLPLLMMGLVACSTSGGGGGGNTSVSSQKESRKGETEDDAYTSVAKMISDYETEQSYRNVYLKATVTHSWDAGEYLYFAEGEKSVVVYTGNSDKTLVDKLAALGKGPETAAGYEVTVVGAMAEDRDYGYKLERAKLVNFNETRKTTPAEKEKCRYSYYRNPTTNTTYFTLDEYTEQHKNDLGSSFQVGESSTGGHHLYIQFGTKGYSKSFAKIILTARTPIGKEGDGVEMRRFKRSEGNLVRYDNDAPIELTYNDKRQIVIDATYLQGKGVNEITFDCYDKDIFSVSFDLTGQNEEA